MVTTGHQTYAAVIGRVYVR